MTDTGAAEVQHYMYNEQDPLNFYIYPPQPSSSPGYVELVYSAVPPPLIYKWLPSTAMYSYIYSGGGYVLPTKTNGYLYQSQSSYDSSDTTGSTEPVWPEYTEGLFLAVIDNDFGWTAVPFDVLQTISLANVYSPIILDYILARAYSVDANISPVAAGRAGFHLNAYLSALGAGEQAESIYDPNIQSAAKPSSRGV